MSSENIAQRGSCRFIACSPRDVHTKGEAIFCGQPVAHPGSSWCREHEAVVFLSPAALAAMRKAA